MNDEMNMLKWMMIATIAVVVMGFAYAMVTKAQDSKVGEACVAAGHEWVQKRGDIYECRK